MVIDSTLSFEDVVRNVLHDMCSEMQPSRKTLDTILHYAATYECAEA